jgi:hypothetical protein
MTIQKAGIGAAIPLLLNPAALGVVAIGAIGWGLFNLLRDEEDGCEEPSDSAQKPLTKGWSVLLSLFRSLVSP